MSDLIIQKDGVSYIRHSIFIEKELKPAIMVPFYGTPVPVIVRRLTYAQIRACGEFSLIETMQDMIDKKGKSSPAQMLAYAKTQNELVRKSLVSPTYDEIMSLNELDIMRVKAEEELNEINKIIDGLPRGPKKTKLKQSADTLEMQAKFFLPSDFISAILSFALQMNDTDIKEVSEDMLYEAACLAKAGKNSPHENLPGNFTDFNKVDIDNRAWCIFYQRQDNKGA